MKIREPEVITAEMPVLKTREPKTVSREARPTSSTLSSTRVSSPVVRTPVKSARGLDPNIVKVVKILVIGLVAIIAIVALRDVFNSKRAAEVVVPSETVVVEEAPVVDVVPSPTPSYSGGGSVEVPIPSEETIGKVGGLVLDGTKTLGRGLVDITEWGVDKTMELQERGAFNPDNWRLESPEG